MSETLTGGHVYITLGYEGHGDSNYHEGKPETLKQENMVVVSKQLSKNGHKVGLGFSI